MSTWTRRHVLQTLGCASLVGSLAPRFVDATPAPARDARPLMRPIPASGELLRAVGYGTYQSLDVDPQQQPEEWAKAQTVIAAFLKSGGGVIDSSPMYGLAEAAVGRLTLAAMTVTPRPFFLATKVWTSGKQAGIAQMESSLVRMGVSKIDLMQVHNLVDTATHMETLNEWRQAGKVRYRGVTHYHSGAYAELEAAMKRFRPEFVQLNYSLAEREAESRLLPIATDLGVAVIVNRPFAQGALFRRTRGEQSPPAWAQEFAPTWAQFFLKFILANSAVTTVIPATRNPKHLQDNVGAGLGRLPTAAERQRMVQWLG
jgi:diketogulonate reductase-like aldo/keto reductase